MVYKTKNFKLVWANGILRLQTDTLNPASEVESLMLFAEEHNEAVNLGYVNLPKIDVDNLATIDELVFAIYNRDTFKIAQDKALSYFNFNNFNYV